MKLLCGKLKSLEQACLIYHCLTEKQGIENQCQFVLLKCMISGCRTLPISFSVTRLDLDLTVVTHCMCSKYLALALSLRECITGGLPDIDRKCSLY